MPEILCPCSGFLSAKDPITWKEKNTPSATKQAWSQLHRWNIGYSEKKPNQASYGVVLKIKGGYSNLRQPQEKV